MKPPNENPAGQGGALKTDRTAGNLVPQDSEVKRLCRPVNAADLAEETLHQILAQVGTSDFAERVARTKADAMRKGTL